MKDKFLRALTLAVLAALTHSTAQAQGTAFTYQGRLNSGAGPANGSYDLTFALFSTASGGSAAAGPLTNSAVGVSNGLFTVGLDFGASVFNGSAYWLEIGVRSNGSGGFAVLAPRQQLTPVPYAIYAEGASAAGISGTIPSAALGGTYGNALALNNANNSFRGTFAGNGAGVINVNAATLNGLSASSFWNTTGNAGTAAAVNFVGTTDNQPLELRVNFQRAQRFELNADSPNVIGGASINAAGPGAQGVTIAGGGSIATYGGPYPNRADSYHATIGGGLGNWIQTNAYESTIAGGNQNVVQSGANDAFIGGGDQNQIQTNSRYSTVGGGSNNTIQAISYASTIGGGVGNTISASNAVICGGIYNTIQTAALSSTISGGIGNLVGVFGLVNTIGGGWSNVVNAGYGTIGGGIRNFIGEYGQGGIISGGGNNTNNALLGTIGGGGKNTCTGGSFTGGQYAVVSGGYGNTSSGQYAAVAGGYGNGAVADYSTVAGGDSNGTGADHAAVGGGGGNFATGSYSTVPGGAGNRASGNYSFAAGQNATATHTGGFVWGDGTQAANSTADHRFEVLASGGVVFYAGGGSAYYTGGNSWSFTSDRNMKENITPVDAQSVLERVNRLPIAQWNMKQQDATQQHMGPMAQDFHAAFGLNGTDDTHINGGDEAGVAFAAIQGLNQKLEQKETEITELKQRLERLEQLLDRKFDGATR